MKTTIILVLTIMPSTDWNTVQSKYINNVKLEINKEKT